MSVDHDAGEFAGDQINYAEDTNYVCRLITMPVNSPALDNTDLTTLMACRLITMPVNSPASMQQNPHRILVSVDHDAGEFAGFQWVREGHDAAKVSVDHDAGEFAGRLCHGGRPGAMCGCRLITMPVNSPAAASVELIDIDAPTGVG